MVEPKTCPRCLGAGILPVPGDDTTVQQCICAYSRALRAHLGSEIASAPLLRKSPLFIGAPPGEPPKRDLTSKNLFIKGYWQTLLSHFKWALGCKGPRFRFRVVTDEKLKVVYVGAESYAARPKGKREEVASFNTLSDLVGPELDLVIVRLGFLGHKNIAMPGILKEALMIRQAACKVTWIVEDPTAPYGPGHFAYSDDVQAYIDTHFERVEITEKMKAPVPVILAEPEPEEDEEDVGLGVHTPTPAALVPLSAPVHRPAPRPTQVAVTDDDIMASIGEGSGSPNKKKYGGGYNKKAKGGGPV